MYGDERNPSKLAFVKRHNCFYGWHPQDIAPGLGSSAHGPSSAKVLMPILTGWRCCCGLSGASPQVSKSTTCSCCAPSSFLLLPQLHLRPPTPLGAHRALPLPDPHDYGGHVAYQRKNFFWQCSASVPLSTSRPKVNGSEFYGTSL